MRLKRKIAPTSRTSAPIVSPARPAGPHRAAARARTHSPAAGDRERAERELRARLDEHRDAETATASATCRGRRVVSARTISHEQSANHGYASDSGMIVVVYDMPGIATASSAAAIAAPPRDEHPREQVRRHRRERHHDRVQVLDRRVGACGRVDPPERRDQVRVERLEEDRLAAPRRMAGRGDRARELRPLELVGEEPRRLPRPRLDEVEGRRRAGRAPRRGRRQDPVEPACAPRGGSPRPRPRPCSLGRRTEHDARIEVDLAPHELACDAGLRARVDDRVEPLARRVRDRHEDDVGLRALEQPRQLGGRCRGPAPRGRGAGGAAGCRRRSRRRARPRSREARASGCARCGPRRRSASGAPVRSRIALRPRHERALRDPRGADHDRAEQRVDDEERAREVPERLRERRCTPTATSSETPTADAIASRSRMPA